MTARDAARRHLLGQVELINYFDSKEDMAATLAAVRFRVVACFLQATHPHTGRTTGRDNCISGLGERQKELVTYVASKINLRREFGHAHLPKREVYLDKKQWDTVLRNIHLKLIARVIELMCKDYTLWRMDGDWLFSHELRTDHDHLSQVARKNSNDYHGDKRTWHGRPKQQRKRARTLRVAPGVSIGGTSS